jgi:hypothetical protein
MPTTRQSMLWLCVIVVVLMVMNRYVAQNRQPDVKIAATSERAVESPPAAASPETVEAVIASPDVLPEITVLPFASELEKDLVRHDNPEASRQAVEQILFFYRRMFRENPVGQNEEITAALLGENKERVAFIPPDSPAIKDGKLVDPWGTPYWFHAQSGQQMEIHSAGPDQQLFTADDLPGTDRDQADEH